MTLLQPKTIRGQKRSLEYPIQAVKRRKTANSKDKQRLLPDDILISVFSFCSQEDAYSFSRACDKVADVATRHWKAKRCDLDEFSVTLSLLNCNLVSSLEDKWDKVEYFVDQLSTNSAIKKIIFVYDRFKNPKQLHSCSILNYKGDFVLIDLIGPVFHHKLFEGQVDQVLYFDQVRGFYIRAKEDCKRFRGFPYTFVKGPFRLFALNTNTTIFIPDHFDRNLDRYQVIDLAVTYRKE